MAVQLDWEIDDVEAPLPDSDPGAGSHPGGCRRRWRFLAFLALAVALGLGFVAFKIRQKQKEIENELRAVVELELSAFIDGDRDLFLNQQDPDDRRWRQVQEEAFDRHHRQGSQAPWEETPQVPKYTGEIPLVRVEGDQGWALVQVARGEHTWREPWFYQWTPADGWRRVRLDPDWLGEEQRLTTLHLRFTYLERDAAIVAALTHEMETWYDTIAPLLGVNPTARTLMTVQFAYRDPTRPYESEVHWGRDDFALLALSPHQSRLSTEGGLIPELHQQMASHMVEALIGVQADLRSTERLPVEVRALYHELCDWAVARLSDSGAQREWRVPPTPLVDALVAREGVQIIPLLTVNLRQAETLDQVLAAAGLDPPDPVIYLAFLLAAANRAFDDLDESNYRTLLDPEADRAWRQYYINLLRRRRESIQSGALWSALSSLQIKSVVFNGEIAWVEAETTRDDGGTYHQAHFFRHVGNPRAPARGAGGWFLTSPDPAYFGERRTTRTENLFFEYFERDAIWFEERMPAELQAIFGQAAADLGLSTDGLIFTVTTELQPGVDGWLTEDSNGLRFTSPSVAGWPVDRLDDPVFQMAFPLLGGLFQKTIENVPEENLRYLSTLVAALLWELERLFPERVDWESLLDIDAKQATVLTLTDLWAGSTAESYEEDPIRIWAGYCTLLEYLVETYGPEVVPALLDNVARTDALDEWLRRSTGDGLEEIEPAWQAWVSSTYGER